MDTKLRLPGPLPALWLFLGLLAGLPGQTVAELARQSEARGFRTGVVVRDLRTGADLFRQRATGYFLPASNQKLLTAAATLWALGAEFEFRTVFRVRGGLLEVHAAGDPNWITGSADDPGTIFKEVAAALRKAGVARIRGVRMDAGAFSGPDRPPGWPAGQFDRTYCAPTGGLVLESGCFRAKVTPAAGQATVELLAPPLRVAVGGAIRAAAKRKKAYSYWISQTGEGFTAHGEIGVEADSVEVKGVAQDPAWVFAESLRSVLAASGVAIDAEAPATDCEVLTWKSGLRPAFLEMLLDSSNFHAEQLLRVLGAQTKQHGTFDAGCLAVRAALATKLELPEELRIVDGSGLSRGNRVSPAFLVALLQRLCTGDNADWVTACLPQGGVSGTLEHRFGGAGQAEAGRATRAKTGYINGVRALSGIVRAADGDIRVFSILMNRVKGTSTRGTKALQDAMVTAIYHGRFGS